MSSKINFRNVIKHMQTKLYYNEEKDRVEDTLDKVLEKTSKDIFFYMGTYDLVKIYYEKNPNSKWKIKNIFQLGFRFDFLEGDDENDNHPIALMKDKYWSLFVFTTSPFDNVIIGFNSNDPIAFVKEDYPEENRFVAMTGTGIRPLYVSHYPIISKMFNTNLNNVIFHNRIPEKSTEVNMLYDERLEYAVVPSEYFSIKYLDFLSRYKKSVTDEFGFPLKNEKILPLDKCSQHLEARYHTINSFKKGDLLIKEFWMASKFRNIFSKMKIAEKDGNTIDSFSIYHPDTFSSYYLWAVLKSEFIKDYCLSQKLQYWDEDSKIIEVEKLPVFIIENINNKYFQKKYELENNARLNVRRKIGKKSSNNFYDKSAQEIIMKDMDELWNCLMSKAYKAAIILAGSVLEAFLIDWLSEKNNKNYFDEDYKVFDKYRNCYKRADLIDYIREINELEKPNWMEAADKATTIRKKRNLVHAKLYINENDISKETCIQVIDYLEYVINTRWN